MAISFDESTDYYTIADDASLTLPNADWCVGIWTRVTDNSGSSYQYVLSSGNWGSAGSFNLYLAEAGTGVAGSWQLRLAGLGTVTSSSTPGADGLNRLIVIQRSGGTVTMYFCTPGGTASSQGTVALSAALDGGLWNVGRRVDGNTARYYGSVAGEFFKGDFALTTEEIEAIANGMPVYNLGHTLDIYQPMDSAEATLYDIIGANDMTRVSAPTTVEHFPVDQPSAQIIQFPAGGAAAINLVTQDGAHAMSSDNVGLTQTHLLTVADGAHALSSDNVDLTQTNILATADSSHALSSDNVTLTQVHVLTVQDATHSHLAANVALTQTHILAVDDALHAHAADNVTLSSALILVTQDGAHVLSSDNVDLTQTHILAVADALHALSSDNVALTQTHILVVDDALHALISDNVTLTIPSGAVTPRERIYIIEQQDRTYLVMLENRASIVESEKRAKIIN